MSFSNGHRATSCTNTNLETPPRRGSIASILNPASPQTGNGSGTQASRLAASNSFLPAGTDVEDAARVLLAIQTTPTEEVDSPQTTAEHISLLPPQERFQAMKGYQGLNMKGNLFTEKEFCHAKGIKLSAYAGVKQRLFKEFHEVCRFDADGKVVPASRKTWNITKAQLVRGLDVNRISDIYKLYDANGLWEQSWRQS